MSKPTLGNPQNTIEILQKYHFNFQKKFGQNFLIDTHVLEKIISAAGITKDDMVLEIGPGIGTMTQYLAEAAGKVAAVEIDKNLIPILEDTLSEYDNVMVINDDVLKVDIRGLVEKENGGRPVKVVANLPYYITTPIIMGLFEGNVPVESITVMVQKEVAERLYAKPGTKDYGALSVWIQSYVRVEWGFVVGPGAFNPPPKVDSAVVTFIPLPRERHPADPKALSSILKLCFQLRRKQLQSILRRAGRDDTAAALERLGIAPEARPETLTPEQFQQLAGIFGRSGC